MRPSRAAESHYRRQLLALSNELATKTTERLLPILRQYESDYVTVRDALITDITSGATYMAIERMIASMAAEVTGGLAARAEAMAYAMVQGVSDQDSATLFSTIQQAYGLDITPLLRAGNIEPTLTLARRINVNLITSIPDQYFDRLSSMVLTGVQQGRRYADLAGDIKALYDVTDNRAKLIARDQTSKTNAAIAEARQTALGIEEYTWATAGDERVRPTHDDNDGKTFRWDSPPPETGHPGHDVACRCVAIPVLSSRTGE